MNVKTFHTVSMANMLSPIMKPSWHFQEFAPDDTLRDPVSSEFFKNTRIVSVIREAIQNSLDAKEDGMPFVRVRIYCSGNKCALPGDSYRPYREGAEEHYNNDGSGLKDIPSLSESCPYLVIEDFNTTGLTGSVTKRPTDEEVLSDRKKGNYCGYFFSENRSVKNGQGTLGSWGAGKIMFMQASRLRTAFTLSCRAGESPETFLVGRTVLKSHSEGDITFTPDGWYGLIINPPSDPQPRYMRKQPITEKGFISRFKKDFHLLRKSEPGTSIVIPFLRFEEEESSASFTMENIARSVVKNFFIAILDGSLQVEIAVEDKPTIHICKNDLSLCRTYLPEVSEGENFITRSFFNLAAKLLAGDIAPEQTFRLPHIRKEQRPVWTDDILATLNLKQIKKLLHSGKPLLFHVPMTIRNRQGMEIDSFDVALIKDSSEKPSRTAFFRGGLLVDNVASSRLNTRCVAIVRIPPNGPLAKFLVSCEPPSHSSWDSSAERAKDSYFTVSAHIDFVTSASQFILKSIESADANPDYDPLRNVFGIPISFEGVPASGPEPTSGPDSTSAQNPQSPPPKHDIPEALIDLVKLHGKVVGFVLRMAADRICEKGYPFSATFKMGYAPFSDTSWSQYDFSLDNPSIITINCDAEPGIVEYSASGNKLYVRILRQGAFTICITGFDRNRDLEIVRTRYHYDMED